MHQWNMGRIVRIMLASLLSAAMVAGGYLAWSTRGRQEVLWTTTAGVMALAWSPDARFIAIAEGGYGSGEMTTMIRVRDAASGEVTTTFPAGRDGVSTLAWSLDGQWLAAGLDDRIQVWRVVDQQPYVALPVTTLAGHRAVSHLAWSRDGQSLLAVDGSFIVRRWRLVDGEELPSLGPPPGLFQAFSFVETPAGILVAGLKNYEDIIVWRAEDATILMQVPLRGYGVGLQLNDASGIQFSPDGSVVAMHGGWSIRLLRVADGSTVADLDGHREEIASMAWSPDGTRIASASGVPREFVPNGHSGDRSVRVYKVADGRSLQVYQGANERMPGLVWSPDGRTLAAGSLDRTVRFWTER